MSNSNTTLGKSSSLLCPGGLVEGDDDYAVFCMTRTETIGLSYIVEVNMISLLAVLLVLCLVLRNFRRHIYIRKSTFRKWRLIQRPMDVYMLSLLWFDLFQAFAAVLDIKWVNQGMTYVGGYCTAQGVIGQLGEAGSAMMTSIISLHSLLMICRFSPNSAPRVNRSRRVAAGVVFFVWIFLILFVAIGTSLHMKPGSTYATPTPYWCWIGSHYLGERLAGEYVWMWLALLLSLMIYVPLFFWKQGMLRFKDYWWQPRLCWTSSKVVHLDSDRRISYRLLAYPAAYAVVVLPVSVIRWMTFINTSLAIPPALTFCAQFCFGLAGLLNVLLLLLTRRGILLFHEPEDPPTASQLRQMSGAAPSPKAMSRVSFTTEDDSEGLPNQPEPAFDRYELTRMGLATATAFSSSGSHKPTPLQSQFNTYTYATGNGPIPTD